MIYNIGIGELVGNAFISYYDITLNRLLSLHTIIKYEAKVKVDLRSSGFMLNVFYHKDIMKKFLIDYSNFFEMTKTNFLFFRPPNKSSDLIREFSNNLPAIVLKSFRDPKNVVALF